jgi:S-DNA-T family DNA segregation ATPase FtsK/SpoIIIE
MGGTSYQQGPVLVQKARVRVPWFVGLLLWLGRRLAALAVWATRHPVLVLVAVVVLVAWRFTVAHGPAPVGSAGLVVSAVLVGWWRLHLSSFTRLVLWRLRAAWRAAAVYRRWWQPAMVTAPLHAVVEGVQYLPRLVSVRCTGGVDVARVRMLPGMTLEDWASVGPELAQTFGVLDCRVRSVPGRVHDLDLWFLRSDPLSSPVDPFVPPTSCEGLDVAGLPVALGEDGLVHRIRLLGTHVLVVGATGSGKGSVIWSMIGSLAPGIRDGLVQVWAIDPKGGMELAGGAKLFDRFVYGDPDTASTNESTDRGGGGYEMDYAHVLEDAVLVMRRRQATLRGVTRLHTPTTAEPLVVIVIDELAALTSYVIDREAKKRITAALSLLLSQGRAVGVTVVGALQDPRKEVVSMRDLFPTRILLRVTEPEHVSLSMGQGARERGARADQISAATPGVAYIGQDGQPEAVRVRFTHMTDHHISALVRVYSPRPLQAVALVKVAA